MRRLGLLGVIGAAGCMAAGAAHAQSLGDAITGGKPILEMRARYEGVDQAGLPEDAAAYTLRTRLGWETAAFADVKGLVEIENIVATGDYNVAVPGPGGASLNGKTRYPAVGDPEVTEINRLQLSWTPSAAFGVTAGRQRIGIDDQRFVGGVAWRQDEQTFDALRFDGGTTAVRATYLYIGRVNRTLGDLRDWDSDSHLVNLAWTVSPKLRLEGFAYALSFANAPASSGLTTGVRAAGKTNAGPAAVAWTLTAARQTDWRNSPRSFDLGYLQGDIAGTVGAWTLKAGYERLDGDGVTGFSTPLGTNHLFQGWSDAFAVAGGGKTGVDGIADAWLGLTFAPPLKTRWFSAPTFTLVRHDFDAQRTGADLASEWDAQATAALTLHVTALLKYADFTREPRVPAGTALAPADRTKLWASLEYRF
ncbi:MAG: hypothetical protein BGN86_05650 [Caulobacterales bacterium 68-7]|nr:MAG: hypothetical protein BGN86_05650 [Caulobacterales bacterium 68-7]